MSAFKTEATSAVILLLKCLFSRLIAVTPQVLYKLVSFPGQISIPVRQS